PSLLAETHDAVMREPEVSAAGSAGSEAQSSSEACPKEDPGKKSQSLTARPTGMRVPEPPDAGLLVRILRETGGTAVAVSKEAIRDAVLAMGRMGFSASPEGAAAWAGM